MDKSIRKQSRLLTVSLPLNIARCEVGHWYFGGRYRRTSAVKHIHRSLENHRQKLDCSDMVFRNHFVHWDPSEVARRPETSDK